MLVPITEIIKAPYTNEENTAISNSDMLNPNASPKKSNPIFLVNKNDNASRKLPLYNLLIVITIYGHVDNNSL